MNPIVIGLKAVGAYILSAAFITLILYWWLDKPQNWPYFIPIMQGFFGVGGALSALEDLKGHPQRTVARRFVGIAIILLALYMVYGDMFDLENAKTGEKAVAAIYLTVQSSLKEWIHVIFGLALFFFDDEK